MGLIFWFDRGYIGIMENKKKAAILSGVILGYSGTENGNCHLGFRA